MFKLFLVLALLAMSLSEAYVANSSDRVESFRELSRKLLPAEESEGNVSRELIEQIQTLIDEEILDNLNSGGPFASEAFLQERLSGFAEQWGWGSFEISRLASSRPIMMAAVQLVPSGQGSSVRLYVKDGERYALAGVIQRDAAPVVLELSAARSGAAQLLLAWVGPRAGRGVFPLSLELIRFDGVSIRKAWGSDQLFPEGLHAFDLSVQVGSGVRLDY